MPQYGLVGYPLSHSFSCEFFTRKFAEEGIDATYENFEMESLDNLRETVAYRPDLVGFNVTIPHKESIIAHLDTLSPAAQSIGAVNVVTVRRRADGVPILHGDNSDIIGFCRSLRPLLRKHHRRALVLGTGGASKAVVVALRSLGISVTYVSRRRPEQPLSVAALPVETIGYEDLSAELLRAVPLVVNTTPVGMFPHVDHAPPLPYEACGKEHLLYDLIYNPLETRFLALGRRYGATTKNGLEMLHLQALAAWNIWQGADGRFGDYCD